MALWGWTDDIAYRPDINDCRTDFYRAQLHEIAGLFEQAEFETLAPVDQPGRTVKIANKTRLFGGLTAVTEKLLLLTRSDYEGGLAWYVDDFTSTGIIVVRRLVKLSDDGTQMDPVPEMVEE